MTDAPQTPASAAIAAFEAQAAADAQAAAVAAALDNHRLSRLRLRLEGHDLDGLLAQLDGARAEIQDAPTLAALWNLTTILRSTLRTLDNAAERLAKAAGRDAPP